MARTYLITRTSPLTPGMVADAGPGDSVYIDRRATERTDWAAMGNALMIAFTRGANVHMGGEETS